jgi:hypothetical protein
MENTRNDFFRIDTKLGWPPRISCADDIQCLKPCAPDYVFTKKEYRDHLNSVKCDPRVKRLLNGRWETLGCHLISQDTQNFIQEFRVRVCLFNYTTNQLIEVYLENKIVVSVSIMEPYEHPETPIEVVQAIGIIKSIRELRSIIEDLEGNGILRVPLDPHGPSYKHRCIHVIFTEKNDPFKELPVLFSAIVDLTTQKVIAFNTTPCGEEINNHSSKDGSKYE